jgi:hypothetical protein
LFSRQTSTSVRCWHVAELTAVAVVADADVAVVGIAVNAVRTLAEVPRVIGWTVTPIVAIFVMSAAIVTLEIRAELAGITIVTGTRVIGVHVAFYTIRALAESPEVMGRTVAPIMPIFVMSAAIVALEIRAELSAVAVVTRTRVVRVHGSFNTIRTLAEISRVMSRTVAPIVAILIRSAAIITLEIRAELACITIVTGTRVVAVDVAFDTVRALTKSPNVMSRTVAPIMAIFVMGATIVTLEVGAELACITIVTGTRVVAVHVSFDTVQALTKSPDVMGWAVAPVVAVLVMSAAIVTLEVRAKLARITIVAATRIVAVYVAFDTVWALTERPDVMGRTVAPIMPILIMSATIVTLEIRAELARITIVTGTRIVGVHVSFDTVRVLTVEACIMGGTVTVFTVLDRRSSIVTHC